MSVKKYIVELREEEIEKIEKILRSGKHSARKLMRAHVLLKANEGKTDQEIAESLKIHYSTVENIRERFVVRGGIDGALEDSPHPPKIKKLDSKGEALLIATACSKPPEGRSEWTMQLLADRLIELKVVDYISDETVRITLKKRN